MASKTVPPRTWAEVAIHSTVPKKSTFSALSSSVPRLAPPKMTQKAASITSKLPRVPLEELDPRNTCLFVTFQKNERCDFATLFSALRRYGRIRYLLEPTDTFMTCVCYETKSAACSAQKMLTSIETACEPIKFLYDARVSLSWAKRRENSATNPTKHRSLLAQISTIREVHFSIVQKNTWSVKEVWLKEELGLESGEQFMSALGPSYALNDSEYAWVGRYPLRSKDKWFSPAVEAKPTLGDLLEASYRRTTLQTVKEHFQSSVPPKWYTPHQANVSPSRELPGGEIMSHSPSASPASTTSPTSAVSSSRSSSGYSTCVGSPASEKANESISFDFGSHSPFALVTSPN